MTNFQLPISKCRMPKPLENWILAVGSWSLGIGNSVSKGAEGEGLEQ